MCIQAKLLIDDWLCDSFTLISYLYGPCKTTIFYEAYGILLILVTIR